MIEFLVVLLFTGAGLHLIFLYMIRPVFMRRIRYRVYELRDNLRLAAIQREIPEKESGYKLLEQHLNAMATNVTRVDLSSLVLLQDREGLMKARADIEVMENSHEVVRKIFEQCKSPTVAAFVLNSPILIVGLCLLIIFALFTHTARVIGDQLFAKAWQVSGSNFGPTRTTCAA